MSHHQYELSHDASKPKCHAILYRSPASSQFWFSFYPWAQPRKIRFPYFCRSDLSGTWGTLPLALEYQAAGTHNLRIWSLLRSLYYISICNFYNCLCITRILNFSSSINWYHLIAWFWSNCWSNFKGISGASTAWTLHLFYKEKPFYYISGIRTYARAHKRIIDCGKFAETYPTYHRAFNKLAIDWPW